MRAVHSFRFVSTRRPRAIEFNDGRLNYKQLLRNPQRQSFVEYGRFRDVYPKPFPDSHRNVRLQLLYCRHRNIIYYAHCLRVRIPTSESEWRRLNNDRIDVNVGVLNPTDFIRGRILISNAYYAIAESSAFLTKNWEVLL